MLACSSTLQFPPTIGSRSPDVNVIQHLIVEWHIGKDLFSTSINIYEFFNSDDDDSMLLHTEMMMEIWMSEGSRAEKIPGSWKTFRTYVEADDLPPALSCRTSPCAIFILILRELDIFTALNFNDFFFSFVCFRIWPSRYFGLSMAERWCDYNN